MGSGPTARISSELTVRSDEGENSKGGGSTTKERTARCRD